MRRAGRAELCQGTCSGRRSEGILISVADGTDESRRADTSVRRPTSHHALRNEGDERLRWLRDRGAVSSSPDFAGRQVVRRPDLLWRYASGAVLVLRPGSNDLLELDGTAVDLWHALEVPRTVDEVSSTLSARYGAHPAEVASDVREALAVLTERDIVQVVE